MRGGGKRVAEMAAKAAAMVGRKIEKGKNLASDISAKLGERRKKCREEIRAWVQEGKTRARYRFENTILHPYHVGAVGIAAFYMTVYDRWTKYEVEEEDLLALQELAAGLQDDVSNIRSDLAVVLDLLKSSVPKAEAHDAEKLAEAKKEPSEKLMEEAKANVGQNVAPPPE